MKNLVLILLLPLFIGCNKEKNETQDYREGFTGNYKCSYLKTLTVYNSETGESNVDTFCFSNDTIIKIKKAENNDEIIFLDWYLKINKKGDVDSGYCFIEDCMDCSDYKLLFSADSIYYFSQCGGHGAFFTYDLSGVKIE